MREVLNAISLWSLPALVCFVLIWAMCKKTPAYENFVQGAKEGFWVAVKIIPYLVAIIVAVSMFRASGAVEMLSEWLKAPLAYFKIPPDTLPLMITRSLSGSATLGLLSDVVTANGVNSYAAKLSAVIVGSSETTFYVLAVYFGSVGIKKFRHALLTGILADFLGIVLAVTICGWYF